MIVYFSKSPTIGNVDKVHHDSKDCPYFRRIKFEYKSAKEIKDRGEAPGAPCKYCSPKAYKEYFGE